VPDPTEPATDTVNVLFALPFDGGVTELGEKPQLMPLGWPEQERATELEKPLIEDTVVVAVPLLPAEMVRLEGLTATAKSGVTGAPGVTVRQVLARV
jgi:hypothetical protein